MDDLQSKQLQLQADLSEVDRLLSLTDNFRLTALLTSFRGQTLSAISSLPAPALSPAKAPAPPSILYHSIDKWAWDQDLRYVKIYVTSLPDLRNVPNEDLQLSSTRDSVDFKVMNIDGANYRLFFKELTKTIGTVTFKTRKDGFMLKMEKSPCEPWNDITFKPTERIKSRDDPQDPLTKARNILLDEYDKVISQTGG